MLRIIIGMLLISVSMTTISSIGPGFEGVLFMDEPKDFFLAEMIFTIGAGIGLPIVLWGIADTAIRREKKGEKVCKINTLCPDALMGPPV